jgi:hypothetical protein
MARDGVANIVDELRGRGFDPRRVGPNSWEARCPAHRSVDHALAISRNEFNHVVLECRSPQNCLTLAAPKKLARAASWPKSAGWFTNELRRIAPQLRLHGLSIEFSRNSRGRLLSITKLK